MYNTSYLSSIIEDPFFLELSIPSSREVLIVIKGTAWYVFSLLSDHSAPLIDIHQVKAILDITCDRQWFK